MRNAQQTGYWHHSQLWEWCTMEETQVPKISSVARIYNQSFFQSLLKVTGIVLENIVYCKDNAHYFVMTAKKQCLMHPGVLH